MLPELPNLPAGQFPILQSWVGLCTLVLVVVGSFISVRKMLRDDNRSVPSKEAHPLANMPQYYFEGPIGKAFGVLEKIDVRLVRVEQKLDRLARNIKAASG